MMFATLIGLISLNLAFLVFLYESNRRRFDDMKSQLNDLSAEVKSQSVRIDGLGARFDQTNIRIDDLQRDHSNMHAQLTGMGVRVSNIEARV